VGKDQYRYVAVQMPDVREKTHHIFDLEGQERTIKAIPRLQNFPESYPTATIFAPKLSHG
jgi:hypothetical protein